LKQVRVGSLDMARCEDVVGNERYAEMQAAVERGRVLFAGRWVSNVNSTARGGGVAAAAVAEMLVSLLAYAHAAGVDARWSVVGGDDRFFAVTKRLHNHLHGSEGDGGSLDDDARAAYEHAPEARALREALAPADLVILHDPQDRRAESTYLTRLLAARGVSSSATCARPTPSCSRARRSSGRASARCRCT
jgi:trehalose synthase